MKTWKTLLSLVLVAVLCLSLFAACAKETAPAASGESSQTPATTPAKNENDKKDETSDQPATTEPAEPETVDPEDVVDIQMYVVQFTGTVEGAPRVQDAINAITEPEIGVHMEMQLFDFGEYATQMGLMAASGEAIDLAYMSFGAAGYSSLYTAGQLMNIRSYLDEYAPGLEATMGDYINTYAIGDGVYALPPYRAYNSLGYILMRKDMLEELGMLDFAKNMKSWADVEELYAAEHAKFPDIYPTCNAGCQDLVFGGETFADALPYDRLGDALYLVRVGDDDKVISHVETQEYLDQVQRAKRWLDAGYIWPDAQFSDEMGDNLIRQNVAFSEYMPSEYGVESAKYQATGYEIVATEIQPIMVCSAHTQKFGICVPSIADEPEAAVKFLEMMYTDKRIIMLLTYGEEGVDYEITATGEADYPAGVESSTVGFHSHDFMVGNQFLITPWAGAGADQREQAKKLMDAAPLSPYLGFTFDSTGFDTVIASLTSVTNEYSRALGGGGYSEATYNEYVDKLHRVGLDEYLDGFQTQLDAWLASK